jgi:hypothetical protein
MRRVAFTTLRHLTKAVGRALPCKTGQDGNVAGACCCLPMRRTTQEAQFGLRLEGKA